MASGRKKAFKESEALNAAMHVFWQKGYTGASLADLTQAMAINKPSMYRTFGNKEALFVQTTEHYVESQMLKLSPLLKQAGQPLQQRLKNYLSAIIDMQCHATEAKGCYLALCQSELTSGNLPNEAKAVLEKVDLMPKELFNELFSTDPQAIALGLHHQAESAAISLYTLLKGTAAMARSGFSDKELEAAMDTMLNGLLNH